MNLIRKLFVFAVATSALLAQTAQFPSAIVTDSQLLKASDQAATTLTSNMGISDLVVNVASTSSFVAFPTVVTIDNEHVQLCSNASGTQFVVCASGRGFGGTSASNHNNGASVRSNIIAWYVNTRSLEIEAIEQFLGVNGANIILPTGSYANPTWITSLAGTKVSLFTNTLQGTVPGSGGGTANFLRADGAWAVPSGSGSGVTTFSGDGTLINNINSSGTVTISLATVGAHKYWGNNSGSTAAPGYDAIQPGDLPTGIPNANLANPSLTYNGVTVNLGSTGSIGCAGGGVNAQTSSYPLVSGDNNKLVTENGASLTATLPAPAPAAPWCATILNLNASALTIARNTLTINGGTSNITLQQYQWAQVWSDGTNYLATAPLVAGSGITITPASNGLSLASNATSYTASNGITLSGTNFTVDSTYTAVLSGNQTILGKWSVAGGAVTGQAGLRLVCSTLFTVNLGVGDLACDQSDYTIAMRNNSSQWIKPYYGISGSAATSGDILLAGSNFATSSISTHTNGQYLAWVSGAAAFGNIQCTDVVNGVCTNAANTWTTGLQSFSAADFLAPVHSSDPGTCTAGQFEFNSTSTSFKGCTATNTWAAIGGGASPAGSGSEIQLRLNSTTFQALANSSSPAAGLLALSTTPPSNSTSCVFNFGTSSYTGGDSQDVLCGKWGSNATPFKFIGPNGNQVFRATWVNSGDTVFIMNAANNTNFAGLESNTNLVLQGDASGGATPSNARTSIQDSSGNTGLQFFSETPANTSNSMQSICIGADCKGGYNPSAISSAALTLMAKQTITATVADSMAGGLDLIPHLDAATAQTVTRLDYIRFRNPSLTGAGPAALTDAVAGWFDAAAGTHPAITTSGTCLAGPGLACIKYNINNTIGYTPVLSTTNKLVGSIASIDLTTQSAAISATALWTPAATQLYRVSYYAKVTTAGTSSILGGTTGLVLAYTDGTDSVAQTAFTLPEDNQAGTALSVGTGNTTNTTQATLTGSAVIYAKTGVGVTYAFGYSSTGTTMVYELHIKVEAL
jgi:hypothetical protein